MSAAAEWMFWWVSALGAGPLFVSPLVCFALSDDVSTREVTVVKKRADLDPSDAFSREFTVNKPRSAAPTTDAFSREVTVVRPASTRPPLDAFSREITVVRPRPTPPIGDVSSREWTVTVDGTLFSTRLAFFGLFQTNQFPTAVTFQTFRVDTGAQLSSGLMLRGPGDRYLYRAARREVDLRVIPPRPFLSRLVRFDLTNGAVLTPILLANGDVNGSGEVDLTDIDLAILSYGTTPDDRDHVPGTDLNFDGEVDLTDIDIIIANYGKADE